MTLHNFKVANHLRNQSEWRQFKNCWKLLKLLNDLKKPNDHVTLLFKKITNFRWPNDLKTRWLNVFLMVTVYRLLETFTFKVTKCPDTLNLEDGGNDPKYQMTIWLYFFSLKNQQNLKWPKKTNDLTCFKWWQYKNCWKFWSYQKTWNNKCENDPKYQMTMWPYYFQNQQF